MTDKYTLDNILSDSGFYEIIKNRLDEWYSKTNKDYTDPEFIAIWSATDYRIKQNRALSNKEEQSKALMDLFAVHSFYPHTQVSGPPVINLHDIEMSPRGDLSISQDRIYSSDKTKTYLTIYATGEMRPLTMISVGQSTQEHHRFSNNSKYIAVLNDDVLRIWDIFQIKIIKELHIENVQPYSQLSWSSDSDRLLYSTGEGTFIIGIEQEEHIKVDIGEYIYTVLDKNGHTVMAITGDRIRFFNVEENRMISEYDFPVPYSGKCISFYSKGSFYTVASGRIIRSTPEDGPTVIKDYSDIMEISSEWRRNIDTDVEPDHTHDYYSESMEIKESVLTYHYPILHMNTECRIDLDTNTVSIYSSKERLLRLPHTPSKLPEEEIEFPFTVLMSESNDPDHFYIFNNNRIVEFKKITTKRRVAIYAYRQFTFKIRMYPTTDNRYVMPSFMKRFGDFPIPENYSESHEDHELDDLTKEYGSEYIRCCEDISIEPGHILYADGSFMWLKHNCNWRKCQYNGCTTFVCSQTISYTDVNNENKRYIPCILEKYPLLIECSFEKMPEINENLLFTINGNIYKINPGTASVDCIITKEELNQKLGTGNVSKIIGDESFMAISLYKKNNTVDLALISDNDIKMIANDIGPNSFAINDKTVYYAKDGCVFSIKDEKTEQLADLNDRNKWIIMGVNDNGVISLSKIKIDFRNKISKSVEMDIARLSPPEFNFDIFENGHLSIEDTDDISWSTDIKGNRLVFRDVSDNPFRRFRATNCIIKATGVRKGNTLMPDTSNFNCTFKQISDKLCLYISNSTDAASDKKMIPEIRPMMRLIDMKTGKMVRRKELKHTEGIMYGPRSFSVRDSKIILLDDDQYIAIEFKSSYKNTILSWDVSSGKQYPGMNKPITTPMIYNDNKTITTGDVDPSTGIIDTLYKLTPKLEKIDGSEIKLNYPLHSSHGSIRYKTISLDNELSISNYSYNGNELKKAYRPADYHRDSKIESVIPLIIPIKIGDGYQTDIFPHQVYDGEIKGKSWLFDIDALLCTLQYGMISNEIPCKITIASFDIDKDCCINELNDSVSVKYHEGNYYVSQLIRFDDSCNRKKISNRLTKISHSGSEIISDDLFCRQYERLQSDVLSSSEKGISFTKFENDTNIHSIINSESCNELIISNDRKESPISVFYDGKLSITYNESNGFITVIKDGCRKTEYLGSFPNIKCNFVSKNGEYHFILDRSPYDEIIVPPDIEETKLLHLNSTEKERLNTSQTSNIITCHGLFGYSEQ